MKKAYMIVQFSLILSLLDPASAVELASKKGTWSQYFRSNSNCVANPLITKATELALKSKSKNLTVVDLGVGTGRNIMKLLEHGATVHAYDADPESIKILQKNFNPFLKNKQLYTYQVSFEKVTSLPSSDLILAWRSLAFMKKNHFPTFWTKIENALPPHAIFVGTFFGEQHYEKRSSKSPELFRLAREEILKLFTNFQIIDFQEIIEYDDESSKSWGTNQYEHIYMIIAKKNK